LQLAQVFGVTFEYLLTGEIPGVGPVASEDVAFFTTYLHQPEKIRRKYRKVMAILNE